METPSFSLNGRIIRTSFIVRPDGDFTARTIVKTTTAPARLVAYRPQNSREPHGRNAEGRPKVPFSLNRHFGARLALSIHHRRLRRFLTRRRPDSRWPSSATKTVVRTNFPAPPHDHGRGAALRLDSFEPRSPSARIPHGADRLAGSPRVSNITRELDDGRGNR
jgi:hypothetical protein